VPVINAGAGVLQVLAIDRADHKPTNLEYLLLTDHGQRYNLKASSNKTSRWQSGMRLVVEGHQLAPSILHGAAGRIPDLRVDDVVSTTAPPASRPHTARTETDGTAPADMSVLFVILTMCNQPASITPAVSCDCESVTRAYVRATM
jgi:hypothetical protein